MKNTTILVLLLVVLVICTEALHDRTVSALQRRGLLKHSDRNPHIIRVGIIQAGELPPPLEAKYGSYGNMFKKFLVDPDPAKAASESFVIFKAFNGDIPSKDAIDQFSGFIVTGSPSDAFAQDPWIVNLRGILKEIHSRKKKLVGICFGHQAIAVALGGKVDRAAKNDWELGLKEIKSHSKGLLGHSDVPKAFLEMESHRDEVHTPPPGALVTSSSEHCKVESYQIPESNPHTLGFQFHPEFDDVYNKESIAFKRDNKWVSHAVAEAALKSFDHPKLPKNPEAVKKLIRDFLKT